MFTAFTLSEYVCRRLDFVLRSTVFISPDLSLDEVGVLIVSGPFMIGPRSLGIPLRLVAGCRDSAAGDLSCAEAVPESNVPAMSAAPKAFNSMTALAPSLCGVRSIVGP